MNNINCLLFSLKEIIDIIIHYITYKFLIVVTICPLARERVQHVRPRARLFWLGVSRNLLQPLLSCLCLSPTIMIGCLPFHRVTASERSLWHPGGVSKCWLLNRKRLWNGNGVPLATLLIRPRLWNGDFVFASYASDSTQETGRTEPKPRKVVRATNHNPGNSGKVVAQKSNRTENFWLLDWIWIP